MKYLLKNGHVIDPGRLDAVMDILVKDGKIASMVPPAIDAPDQRYFREGDSKIHVVDLTGKIFAPGLIDMHVHFREPGQEHKETIETGSRSAVHGGFTAVCTMPNTAPPVDSIETLDFVIRQAKRAGLVKVYPVAAISSGLAGQSLTDFDALKAAGAIAFSDDGMPVKNSRLMRQALEEVGKLGLPVISHCEDPDLAPDGVINEGRISGQLKLPGIPNAVESIMVLRDIALCELTGAPLHIAHVSTRQSVRAVREAKKRGIPVTAETAPHYFSLTEDAVLECQTNAKMNPPLRSEEDREAILEGLADGTIDVIATDHAPHAIDEKAKGLMGAPNGIIGLETAVGLGAKLVFDKVLTWSELISKMSLAPARILNISNELEVGMPADITVIDPQKIWSVDPNRFQSKSGNTPFADWTLTGKPVMTIVDGRIVYEDKS